MSGFLGAFATGVACQHGTLALPGTWFRPTIMGLACAPIVETRFLELVMTLLDFSPRISLGIFSILLGIMVNIRNEYIFSEFLRNSVNRSAKETNRPLFVEFEFDIEEKNPENCNSDVI